MGNASRTSIRVAGGSESYQAAIEVDANYNDAFNNLGTILLGLEQNQETMVGRETLEHQYSHLENISVCPKSSDIAVPTHHSLLLLKHDTKR